MSALPEHVQAIVAERQRRLTVHQAAAVLGEHPQTTYRRLRSGELRGHRYTQRGHWFIEPDELERFLKPHRGAEPDIGGMSPRRRSDLDQLLHPLRDR